ncbi:unnamed protein product, partial [marine sediment metagenome]
MEIEINFSIRLKQGNYKYEIHETEKGKYWIKNETQEGIQINERELF